MQDAGLVAGTLGYDFKSCPSTQTASIWEYAEASIVKRELDIELACSKNVFERYNFFNVYRVQRAIQSILSGLGFGSVSLFHSFPKILQYISFKQISEMNHKWGNNVQKIKILYLSLYLY